MLTFNEGNKIKNDFWDKNAKIYDKFMKKDSSAYEQMYSLIRPAVKNKDILYEAYRLPALYKMVKRRISKFLDNKRLHTI